MNPIIDKIEELNKNLPVVEPLGKGSITVSEFANDLHLAPEQGEHLVKILVDKGYLHTASSGQQTIYKIHFARKRKKRVPTDIWDSLDF